VISEGANFTASIISQRFAIELAHTLNEKLNEERWRAIVGTAAGPRTLRSPSSPRLPKCAPGDGMFTTARSGSKMGRRGLPPV